MYRPAEAVVHRVGPALGIEAALLTAPHDLPGATAVAVKMLNVPDRPTAVLCLSDSLAYGVYAAARELGLELPADLSIMGFDDHPLSALLTPPLSSYGWPVEELVTTVVQRTVEAIDHGDAGRRRVLVAQPRRRGSVAAPRTATVAQPATQAADQRLDRDGIRPLGSSGTLGVPYT